MTLSFAQKCLYPHQGLLCAFFLLLKAFVELKVGRKTKAYLFQICCKVKDRTQRVSKSYNHDREVHVCGYVVDGVESKRIMCSMILSLPSYILGMANFFLIFAWTFMCPSFFFMGLHVPSSSFFQYIAHALIRENFGRNFMEYGTYKRI